MPTGARSGVDKGVANRAYWLKTLHQWHWVSSALCLIGMLLFSLTGITLNHASQIEARPRIETRENQLPARLLAMLTAAAAEAAPAADGTAARAGAARPAASGAGLPSEVQHWLRTELGANPGDREAEWSADEVYVAMPRPGGDAWVRIGLEDGLVEYESTDRGWISYLNDLHKGRNSGIAWSVFIDVFAVACLLFSITGLLILKMHAASRPTTWPVVGLGVVLPALLAILFIH